MRDELVRAVLRRHPERLQALRDAPDVVGIGGAETELDEAPRRRRHQSQLLAAVDGRETSVAERRQAELLVVGRDRGHVRNAEGDRRESMERHGRSPFRRRRSDC